MSEQRQTNEYLRMVAFVLLILFAIVVVEANVNKRQQDKILDLQRRIAALEQRP